MAKKKSSRLSGKMMGKSGNGNSPRKMEVLEIETEAFLPSGGSILRRKTTLDRSNGAGEAGASDESESTQQFCGMSNTQRRAFFLMVTLALLVGVYVFQMDETVEVEMTDLVGDVEKKPNTIHTNSFGGINNIAHPGGAKAAAKGEGIAFEDIVIPKSNVGHAVPSLSRPNVVNALGHYIHDEHRSPYASHMYNATKEELEERQQKYVEKMAKVREEWGAWDFRDPLHDDPEEGTDTPTSDVADRSEADFSGTDYKDLAIEEFPPDAWQADEEYVSRFLEEGKKLVNRVKEGIKAEIGWPVKEDEEYMKLREELFKIHVWDHPECDTDETDKNMIEEIESKCGKNPSKGLAVFQKIAFEGLIRKLLHSMMTNDEFYVVLAGHSAAAGHGNDFQQNRIITFHHLMEPVFDKLGMRLVSRNMGMGGVGTLQFSLAGGDLYGETDFLEWDSGMTEKGGPVDLFNKQAILSGERVPVIMNDFFFNIMEESDDSAWMGRWLSTIDLFPETTYENADDQPWAARWYNQKEEKFNAICWEPRSDFTPETVQNEKPGSQVGWHPGNRHHRWDGRKVALVVLEALGVAFERWEEGIAKEGCPLEASYWHVGDYYKDIREKLRTHVNKESREPSECEEKFGWISRICRVQMHGFGMWKPRAHIEYDLLNIIHAAPNGYKPGFERENAYTGFDVLPLNQAVPDGEVDAHAIAIATTSPPPDLDHSWIEDSGDEVLNATDLTGADEVVNSTVLPPPTRRWLREASELGFRRAAEELPPSNVVKKKQLMSDGREKAAGDTMLRRQEETTKSEDVDKIVPGRGWEMHGWSPVKGFCDGSAQSECKRAKDSDCLLAGHNDNHIDVWGNSLSGWLVFTVPKVREGIILIRIEWWCGVKGQHKLTENWDEVNDGKTDDTTPWDGDAHRALMDTSMDFNEEDEHRNLGGKAKQDKQIPKDLEMDIAINGKLVKTMKYDEWLPYTKEITKNVAVWPLLDDISMAERDWEGEAVEAAIRFRTKPEIGQKIYPYCVSHVYYA